MKVTTYSLRGVRWLLMFLGAVYLVFTMIGFLVYYFLDPNTSSIEFIKTVFKLSLWLAVPVLFGLLVIRAWRLSFVAALVAVIFAFIYLPDFFPRMPEVGSGDQRLTVMTFNLETTSQGIAEVIRAADADIVALQELSQVSADALLELENVYPYQALHPQADANAGQGIMSRYPIESNDYWEYPEVPHTLGHQRVEIDFDGTLIVIYNTHPWPPLAWKTGFNDESHRVVLEDLASRTFAEELPLIWVGDFNMTDSFQEYDLLTSRFIDSYDVVGIGLGYTFPNYKFEPFPAFLRLDYIWHSAHFDSIEARVWGQHAQSDHSPVVGILALR